MRQQWADYRLFWREFRRQFQSTGAVLPSGRSLGRALSRHVRQRADAPRRILEVGPGTGAVTRHIIAAMGPEDRLDLIEKNEQFVARLAALIRDDVGFQSAADRVTLIEGTLEELPGDGPYDLIISGLPLNNFSVDLVGCILDKLDRLLGPHGTLSFFEYIGIRRAKSLFCGSQERARLAGIEESLGSFLKQRTTERDQVLANVPPAWVHHVRQGGWNGGMRLRADVGSTMGLAAD